MMIHPVRMTGMVIGAVQTYEYFQMIEDRIISFVAEHSRVGKERLKALMHKDVYKRQLQALGADNL